jgi:L-ascorbate 6-phosphate lactonase
VRDLYATVGLELTWLGQSGFALFNGGTRVLIDPFLSEDPLRTRAAPDPATVANGIDWLLVTHEHGDHLDTGFLKVLLQRSPALRVMLPRPLVGALDGLCPPERVHGVSLGERIELAPHVSLEVMPAFHAVEVADGYDNGARGGTSPRFVGYLLSFGGLLIYHAGDTLVTAELIDALSGRFVDVALLPINGRDYFREEAGLVGNMNVREAVMLAERVGVSTLVPMHWDLIEGNTERPGAVLDEVVAGDGRVHVLALAPLLPYRLL